MAYVLVAVGGALGALARWAVATALPSPTGWPWATLLVNLTGCLLMGVLISVLAVRFPDAHRARTFFGAGVLGGYTTYSAFAVEVVRLAESGAVVTAGSYVLASVVGGVTAVALGTIAAHALLGRPA